jgi:V8-like Glu-specific endopeptidase
MYLYEGRSAPAQQFLSEAPAAVANVPLTKVFATGVTAMHPFSAVCRVEVQTVKGGISIGSGVLISRYHVLTCAHILFDAADPLPQKVTVLPNHDGKDEKRKPIVANAFSVKPGWNWRECRTADDDLAIIRLSRKADADFLQLQNFNPAVIAGNALTLAGYPVLFDKDRAYLMYRSQGSTLGGFGIQCCYDAWPKKCNPPPNRKEDEVIRTLFGPISDATKLIGHTLDSRHSMSGGPMWIYDNKKPILVALHAGKLDGKNKKAVLLNSSVRALVNDWMTRQFRPLN